MRSKLSKLFLSLFLVSVFSFATVIVSAASDNETWFQEYSKALVAGKSQVVGEISIWTDDDGYLHVMLKTSEGFMLSETHIHVADEASDIPQTKKGNPIPGQFEENVEHDPVVSKYTYISPELVSEIDGNEDGEIAIAIHSVVNGDTVWGVARCEGMTRPFEGPNWAVYIIYRLPSE